MRCTPSIIQVLGVHGLFAYIRSEFNTSPNSELSESL